MRRVAGILMAVAFLAIAAPPQVRMVEVGDGVRIEVLDFGGSGRAVILLAGSGNSGHVFEDFAPKLTGFHVYAVSRRGYGASSQPERGYSVPELAEDIWRVKEALQIDRPVIAGHSMAGSEVTFLGQKHSSDLGGLIYLDAIGDPMDWPWGNSEYRELVTQSMKDSPPPAPPGAADLASVEAYREYQRRTGGFPFPAGEIRAIYEIRPDGSRGSSRTPGRVSRAIDAGSIPRDYRGITAPVLVLVAVPGSQPLSRADTILMTFIRRWEGNVKQAVPAAKVVEMPGAHHYLFQQEEADVLREMRAFLEGR